MRGRFVFLHFVPMQGQRPLVFHQWDEGGQSTDVELVGMPGGGTYKVIKSCESPLGMERTLERGGETAESGEVPGYHFKSLDGAMWFDVTTAPGDAYDKAWQVKRALVVVHGEMQTIHP